MYGNQKFVYYLLDKGKSLRPRPVNKPLVNAQINEELCNDAFENSVRFNLRAGSRDIPEMVLYNIHN